MYDWISFLLVVKRSIYTYVFYHLNYLNPAEGRDREAETKAVMKQLEKKYAALQVVSVIKKLGNKTVSHFVTPHI